MPRVNRRIAVADDDQIAVEVAALAERAGAVNLRGVAIIPAEAVRRHRARNQFLIRGRHLHPRRVEVIERFALLERLDRHRPERVIDGGVGEDRLQIAAQLFFRASRC
jgi:hypothetical protein